ncbi:MAG TPA: hypothetical protein PK992_01495 [Planctomycetaceae bacterium]|nr:hypothetical protein [Planctomycetaceae bacterium]
MSNYIATYLVLPTGGVVALPADSAGTRANKVLKWSGDGMTLINTAVADGIDGEDGLDGDDGTDGVGVPSGGTTNQQLRKLDGTDYNTEWHTLVLADISDVTVTDDYAEFEVGIRPMLDDETAPQGVGYIFRSVNNGHVYYVHEDGGVHLLCSGDFYGGGGESSPHPVRPGIGSSVYQSGYNGIPLAASCEGGTMQYVPIYLQSTAVNPQTGIYVHTADSGGTSVRIGVYANNNGKPGSRLSNPSALAFDTSGEKGFSQDVTLEQGWYFLGVIFDNSSSDIIYDSGDLQSVLGLATASGDPILWWSESCPFESGLPATASSLTPGSGPPPRIWMKV